MRLRLAQRPADRYRLYTVALVLMLTLAGINGQGGRGARAQDGFDLPPLDDYTGLTALTANSSDGVNLRAEPSVDADLLVSVPVGNVVDLRVDELNTVYTDDGIRWWPVRIWEIDGWIAGMYLEDVDGSSDDGDTDDGEGDSNDEAEAAEDIGETGDAPADEGVAGAFAAGDFVAVATDDGGNLAMRAGPGTSESRIAWLGDGDVIQVVDGPIFNQNTAWYLITDGSINAYVFGDYLAGSSDDGDSDEGPSDGPSVDAPSQRAARFEAGNAVAPVDGIEYVNVRARVSANSGHLGALVEGQAVEVVDGPFYDPDGADWYLVDLGDGTEGYIWGDGLDRVSRELLGRAAPLIDAEPVQSGPTGTLVYPLTDYVFTQAFGCSPYAFEPYDANLGCPYHNGIDLAAPLGTPLTAADGGTVKFAGWCDCGLGYYVEVEHGNGIATIYGHMNALYVSTGQTVAQGEVLGEVGSTGFSTGPHIHFMVKVGGVPVDPLGYLS